MTKYVLSTMTNSVSYRNYRYIGDKNATQNQSLLPIPADTVIIRGGANRPSQKGGFGDSETDASGNILWTPHGVVTTLTDEEYERLQDHWLFKKHLAGGFLAILDEDISANHKKVSRIAEDLGQQDPGAQLTKDALAQRIKVKTPDKELNTPRDVTVMPAYNDANFRKEFPAFADPVKYTPEFLGSCWNMAAEFISGRDCPCRNVRGDSLQLALDLMCAHIATLLAPPDAASGEDGGTGGGGLITSASIGAVSVGVMQPPVKGIWGSWLGQTPHGQALLALFAVKSVGGFYVGGLPERVAFRKVGGVFW